MCMILARAFLKAIEVVLVTVYVYLLKQIEWQKAALDMSADL